MQYKNDTIQQLERAMESDTTNALKSSLSLKMAMPSLSLYPPDSIKLAAKDTVAKSAATSKWLSLAFLKKEVSKPLLRLLWLSSSKVI